MPSAGKNFLQTNVISHTSRAVPLEFGVAAAQACFGTAVCCRHLASLARGWTDVADRQSEKHRLPREDDVFELEGIMILVGGLCFMLAMWAGVICGAQLFGPR